MKQTKSGKVACGTPGCHRTATHIVHVAHIRSWGRPKDLYHCEKHAHDGGTIQSSNPAGYVAEAEQVQLSPLCVETWGHRVSEVR